MERDFKIQLSTQREAANEVMAAHLTPGGINDNDIEVAIRRELRWNAFVPHDQIRASVKNGWVTVEGTVDFIAQRTAVEAAIENVEGVRGLTNQTVVDGHSFARGSSKNVN